jgi:integrase
VYCAAIVAANTSMRPVEVKHLRRCDIDLVKRLVHVRRSKNETSHRVIPLNASAIEAAARMFERADLLGHTEPEHYLWPACQWGRFDAKKPMLKWDTAWRALRDEAGLHGLRFVLQVWSSGSPRVAGTLKSDLNQADRVGRVARANNDHNI